MSIQTPIKKYFKSVKMPKKELEVKPNESDVILLSSDSDSENEVFKTSAKKYKVSGELDNTTKQTAIKINQNIDENLLETTNVLNDTSKTPKSVKNMICINRSNIKNTETKENVRNNDNHMDKKLFDSLIINTPIKSGTQDVDNSIAENENELSFNVTLFDPNVTLDESEKLHNYQTVFLIEVTQYVLSQENYKCLFTTEENKQIIDFMNLSHEGKNFCARLFFRKYCWHRLPDFVKSIQLGIDENEAVLLTQVLTDLDFISTDYSKEDPELMLNLLNLNEIKQLHTKYKLSKMNKNNKKDMINSILRNMRQQTTLSFFKSSASIFNKNIQDVLKICIKVTPSLKKLFLKLQLLYSFTNPMLKLPNDLYRLYWDVKSKKIKFPDYTIDHPQIFSNIEHFSRYEVAHDLHVRFEEAVLLKEANESVFLVLKAYETLLEVLKSPEYEHEYVNLPRYLQRFTTGYNLISIVSHGMEVLKREASGKYVINDANEPKKNEIIKMLFKSDNLTYEHICEVLRALINQNIYMKSKKGVWYEQLLIIYSSHLHRIEQAGRIIIMALESENLSEIFRLKFSHRAESLTKSKSKVSDELKNKLIEKVIPEKKHKSKVITSSAISDTIPGHKRVYVQSDLNGKSYMSVEQVAINYYVTNEGYEKGLHCEGSTVVTLFGLLFWDLIYEYHVPNTFVTCIQEKPLDLYSYEFYQNRKDVIDDRLTHLLNEYDIEAICTIIVNNSLLHSEEISFINRNLCSEPAILINIARCMGVKVLGKICERLSKSFGLSQAGFPDLLLWSSSTNKCKFVEVKGQGDKLSEKQILWLEYLTEIDADAEVCHVHTTGTKRSKKVVAT